MTEVRIGKYEHEWEFAFRGHQDGERGRNIYCAAVSMIACSLVSAVVAEGEMIDVERGDGFLRLRFRRTERTDAMADMAETGLELMRKKYGTIEIKKVEG